MTNESFSQGKIIKLPAPQFDGPVPVEAALRRRRSVRAFKNEPLSLETTSQLLWSVQGVTTPDGMRTAPSAGPCYPLETYLVAGDVTGLPQGLYRYCPRGHELVPVLEGDLRAPLAAASLKQRFIEEAPLSIVLTAVYERTTKQYGERGIRYVHMDAGHAGENLHLQVVPLGLGTVMVGAFEDESVHRVLRLPAEEHPLYIMPVGRLK